MGVESSQCNGVLIFAHDLHFRNQSAQFVLVHLTYTFQESAVDGRGANPHVERSGTILQVRLAMAVIRIIQVTVRAGCHREQDRITRRLAARSVEATVAGISVERVLHLRLMTQLVQKLRSPDMCISRFVAA